MTPNLYYWRAEVITQVTDGKEGERVKHIKVCDTMKEAMTFVAEYMNTVARMDPQPAVERVTIKSIWSPGRPQ